MKNILRVFAVMVTMLLSLVYITTQTIAPDYGFELSSNALAAEVASSESILPTGQSGNVFSPFYDNQAELYHAGEFRKQRMDRADIESVMTSRAFLRSKR